MSVVVSDTSPLQYLIQCHAVETLPIVFDEVLIPPTVRAELQHPNCPVVGWMRHPPFWLKVQAAKVIDATLRVDPGEREAISLAKEVGAAAILIDDRKGRTAAARSGLRVIGTIGFLEEAASRGLVDFRIAIAELLQTNARVDIALVEAAMQRLSLD
jgi:predicted nucleic acid-binding protein